MNYLGNIPEDYVHICYHRATYLKFFYSNVILPVQSQELWVKTNKGKVLPPVVVRMPGRPKKARRRDPTDKEDERGKANRAKSRKGMKMSCRICGKSGHNLRSCTIEIEQSCATSKKASGSKRKKLNESTNIASRNDEGLTDVQNDEGLTIILVRAEGFSDEEFWTQIGNDNSIWNLGNQSEEQQSHIPNKTGHDSVSSKSKSVMPEKDITAKSVMPETSKNVNLEISAQSVMPETDKNVDSEITAQSVMPETNKNVNSEITTKSVGKTATVKNVIGKPPLKKLTVRRSSRIMNATPKGPA